MNHARARELEHLQEELERFLQNRRPEDRGMPGEVKTLLHHIHDRLFDPDLSVKTLRSRCRLRDNNVSSRFRWLTGMTIKECIESLRMEAAAQLLRRSASPVFDIALSVGYSHPQTFYRAFEKTYECTPAIYRQRSMRKAAANAASAN